MKKISKCAISLGLIASVSAGCAKSSDSAATTVSVVGVGEAVTAVRAKAAALDSFLPDEAGASTVTAKVSMKPAPVVNSMSAFSSTWSGTQALSNPRCSGGNTAACSTSVSPKEWMGYQLDPDAVRENGSSINVFGRLKNALMIGCAVSVATPTGSDGYVTVGSHTITFTVDNTALMVALCGMTVSEAASMVTNNTSLTATVSLPTDTTLYDRKIIFDLPASMGGATQYFYMRTKTNEINIATVEMASDGGSRTLVAYKNGVIKVEYDSQKFGSQGSHEFGRLLYDELSDLGAIMYSMGGEFNSGASFGYMRYTMAGKPKAGGTIALSMDLKEYGNYTGNFDRAACVDPADGTIKTDGSLDCTVTGKDVDDEAVALVWASAPQGTENETWFKAPLETTTTTFTNTTDIFTALTAKQ